MPEHHYLPQFYLKGFSDPDPPRNHVWIHHQNAGWERRSVKRTAAEAGYYSLADESGSETDELETLLMQVENIAATIIREKVRAKKLRTSLPLTSDEQQYLALFVAIMQARVPGQHEHFRGFLTDIAKMTLAILAQQATENPRTWEGIKKRYEAETGETLPKDFQPEDLDPSRYVVKAKREAAIAFSFSSVEFVASVLMTKGWRFLLSEGPTYFITSDYPVGVYEPSTEDTFHGPALASSKTEVSFPMTSTVALVAGGEINGVAWSEVPERLVRQINARTAMRASFLVAPKPSAVGVNLAQEPTR